MNNSRLNTALLVAVIFTILAIVVHRFIPPKRLLVTPNPDVGFYLYSTNLDDGTPAGIWLDEAQRKFRCVYPENAKQDYYCAFNQMGTPLLNDGIDLSDFEWINIHISYSGPTPKIRLFMRNFNTRYSSEADSNSTKYNTLFIPVQNLNRYTSIKLSQLKVAEWWLIAYGIPIEEAHPEFDNVVNIGVDFSDFMDSGNHDVTIEKIELVGEWISKEHWYLIILCVWLFGIGLSAANQLRLLREKNRQDRSVINRLNMNNAQLKTETEKFRRLSTVDPLTQTYNRFGIDQILNALHNEKRVKSNPFSHYALIVIDLDLFKTINDSRGHDAGDRVLREVAALMESKLRRTDYLGRWGGEEFVILLPDTNQDAAMVLAEKIRQAIAEAVFEPEDPLRITASFGVGEQRAEEDFLSTFKRVDAALYSAKMRGRNTCVLAT